MNQGYTSEQTSVPQEFHLSDYVNIIWKRKRVAITFLLVVVCIVAVKTYYTKPVYQATAQISIEGKSSFMKDMTKIGDANLGREYLETQYKLLKSKSLASKTIEALKLREYVANRRIYKPDYVALALAKVKSFPDFIMGKIRGVSDDSPSAPNYTAETQHMPSKEDPVASWYL